MSSVTLEDAIGPDSRGERERVERTETEQVEEDYEGEDEYEDELKAVAESHEAMSRDDTRNSNVSTAASTGLVDGTSSGSKNFDSREVITVNSSDEDVASNEAITDEIIDKYDQEVCVFSSPLFFFPFASSFMFICEKPCLLKCPLVSLNKIVLFFSKRKNEAFSSERFSFEDRQLQGKEHSFRTAMYF